MKETLLRALGRTIVWMGRVFGGYNRLEKLKMVQLQDPIAGAISLYGPPLESEAAEDFPEATEHTFDAGPYHEAVIYEWNNRIHSITYWSTHPDPANDLAYMLKRFGEGHEWRVLTEGYSYQRADGKVRLWCSAAPGIGVATSEYQDAMATFRRGNESVESD